MDQAFQPLVPAHSPAPPATLTPAETPAVESRSTGFRRVVLTGAISALLLVGGGVAAVSAASPAPSTAPGTTVPSGTPHGGSTANCPNMGGSSGSGGSSSSGSSAPAATPAT